MRTQTGYVWIFGFVWIFENTLFFQAIRVWTSIVFAWMEERGVGDVEFLFLRAEVGSSARNTQLHTGMTLAWNLGSNAENS